METSDTINILMVDDQPAKLLSYEAILDDMGMQLFKASSPRDALEVLLKHEIAIVLMDVSMPEMDGFELAAMIREHPRYTQTAIIFISAVRLTELDRLRGYQAGAIDYLPVPIIPEILRAKVSAFADLFRKTKQLEELNRELERRVEQRTVELQAALQVRDEFLSVAAHELKTPLTGLRATAQVLSRRIQKTETEVAPWLTEGLRILDQQSDRLARLVGQLLDVSRLDRGRLAIEMVPTDLSEMAERLVSVFQTRSTKHTLSLSVVPDLRVVADPLGIEQVFSNLLDNAVKYSPEGGKIEVELGRGDADEMYFAVRDHGIGIAPEKREAIFGRFYQAHADDYRSGLGLGLYISHQIIEQHGGRIAVEFPADGGTRFVVSLPTRVMATVSEQ